MDPELVAFHAVILKAKTCEDVFGALAGDRSAQVLTARTLYRKFASIVHEDRHANDDAALILAHEAFSLLSAFWREARLKIEKGTYGTTSTPKIDAVLASQKHTYRIDEAIGAGDLANLYAGVDETGKRVIVKVSRLAAVNDLLMQEAVVLADLTNGVSPSADSFGRLFPPMVESFRVKHQRIVQHVNVFEDRRAGNAVFSLHDVVLNFPGGIDPRHFVWIFKRLLMVLSYAHGRNWVHGAVLPTHVLVRPADHGILLVDWAYAVQRGQRLRAISPAYKSSYAPEVFTGKASSATDLYMAAKCMLYILGDVVGHVPGPFLAVLNACLLPNPYRRSPDALAVYDALEKAAKAVYGAAEIY